MWLKLFQPFKPCLFRCKHNVNIVHAGKAVCFFHPKQRMGKVVLSCLLITRTHLEPYEFTGQREHDEELVPLQDERTWRGSEVADRSKMEIACNVV
jgi:hypothetical protein